MPKHTFAQKWTNIFWKKDHINAHTAQVWHQQLVAESHLGWHRLVCSNWQGEPLRDLTHVKQIVQQLGDSGYTHFFLSPRGRSSHHAGVQVWSAEPELPFVVTLFSAPLVSARDYTPKQFEDNMIMMLSWLQKP